MKKIVSLLVALALLTLCLSACSTQPAQGTDDGTDAEKTYTVGILQLTQHQALDAATQGFEDALTNLLGDKVTFNLQNANGNSTECTTIANQFVSSNYDLIMANATSALQAAAAATSTIPVVGTSVTDYYSAGVFAEGGSNEATGTNVTGASDLAPIDQQIEMLKEVVPNAQKVAVIYCSGEPNSVYQATVAEAALDANNIAWEAYTIADANDINGVVTTAIQTCDTIYIPTDNTIANAMASVANVTVPAKIPVICGEENMTAAGGLATLSISYYDMGYSAGEMAYEILVNGADPSTMPIAFVSAESLTKKYNAENAEAIGWTIPDGYTAIE